MMRCHAEEFVVVAIEFCQNESGQKLFSGFFGGNWSMTLPLHYDGGFSKEEA